MKIPVSTGSLNKVNSLRSELTTEPLSHESSGHQLKPLAAQLERSALHTTVPCPSTVTVPGSSPLTPGVVPPGRATETPPPLSVIVPGHSATSAPAISSSGFASRMVPLIDSDPPAATVRPMPRLRVELPVAAEMIRADWPEKTLSSSALRKFWASPLSRRTKSPLRPVARAAVQAVMS